MELFFCRHLAAIILLVALFLAPLVSVAHSTETGMMEDSCACHLLLEDCGHETNDNRSELPCDTPGDCCDEDCCHDVAEPPFTGSVNMGASMPNRFYPYSPLIPPKVYLAIFVPPES